MNSARQGMQRSVPLSPSGKTWSIYGSLFADAVAGCSFRHAWSQKAWFDIVLRYRRTLLGPLWMVITTGVMIACLSLIAPALFGGGNPNFIPFLTVGIITWNFIALSVSELSNTFIEHSSEIQAIRVPFSNYVYRILLRNLISYAHLMVIYAGAAVYFGISAFEYYPVFLFGLVLTVANLFWVGFVLGILCARFRDIQQVVNAILTVGFLLTPVFWDKAALIGARQLVVLLNPLAHALEVLRAPLLDQMPAATSVIFLTISAVVGMGLAELMYRRLIHRVAFWV